MDPPLVAASASDAAGLGVQLAQDLYRLASEYPSVECQIGRIAQAFVDLNLTLADLASALASAGSPVSLSPSCLERVNALIDRIHGVQKTFFEGLNEDVSSPSGKKQPAAAAKKSTTKLGRLKTLFPGSGADERFTEMEWMRNSLALLAAVLRLGAAPDGITNQTRFRIASETLTSAVIIYVRTIEQRLAGPDDDDQSDDEEPITGPGSLLYVAPAPPPPPKETKKGKNKVRKQPIEPTVDAADWIYQGLRDRIKENDRAENLSSQFVEWLLEESVVVKPVENSDAVEVTPTETTDDKTTDAVQAALEPEPETAPVFLSKKALKKLAKNKGKAKAVKTTAAEPESEPERADDKADTTNPEDDDIAKLEKAIADAQAALAAGAVEEKEKAGADAAAPEAPPTDQSGTPKATAAAAQAEPSKSKDAKFERHDIEQDHDDLPPPYPSPDAFMPPGGRGAPFAPSHFPYPGANPMAYQTAPGAPFDIPPYMQSQAAMFHGVGFYPVHPPYMAAAAAAQPFYGPRGAAAADAYGAAADPYDSHAPARPFPSMRRGSIERPYRDVPGRDSGRGGALVPRRRAGTYGDGKYEDEEHFDEDVPANRRRGTTGRRRRDTDESQETNDDKENEQDGPSNKSNDDADREKDDAAPTEMSLERVPYRPKKAIAVSSKPAKKGNGKAVASDDEGRHYSDAETVDMRNATPIASNSSKKRNAKTTTAPVKRAGQSSKESSPPPVAVLPTPPTPPSAAGEDDEAVEASTSKSKKSKAKSKAKNTTKAQAKEVVEDHHSDTEPETKDKDDSEYESANEGNDDKDENDGHDDDNDDGDHDHEDETQFSPDTEHRVFTPPPTPPHVPHPGEAPVPPPAAYMHPRAPHPGGPPGAAIAPGGYPGMPPYFAQPQHPSMMGAHPYQAQRRGGPEAAAGGYGPNVDMEQMWASFWSERMGMPPPAAPWAAGAPAPAAMDGPRGGPPAAAKGLSSNWIRGEDHAMPVRGPPPAQVSGAPPPSRPQQRQQYDRYRSRMHDDDHEHDRRGPIYEHSEDEEYDGYGHHDHRDHRDHRDHHDRHDPRDHRDQRDDYDDRGPVRRDPYHAADYPPRRRSRSPPYHAQDRRRDYHEQQRQQRPRYHPDESPSPPRGWERDDRDDRHDRRGDPREHSPPNHHHGGQHHQQTPQQQYRNPYHAYYDQPRRPSFSKGAPTPAEWGWPGDVNQPLHQQQPSQMPPQMPSMPQMPPIPQMTPQMPPMFPQAPPQHGGHPPPGWDDGWNDTYRQNHRGHAEFSMTEINS
ncbi:hypothetical protein Sste5346_001450 [Sporothrix stenoceras]|uniref:Uncharacterized protein n=1 Tax=Sporothrix stenoceras TaxID=5173 RepID=A0ABR3ZPR3_9PEZI